MSWKGYYVYDGKQYQMNFKNFHAQPVPEGGIHGDGEDEVGTFRFSGNFSSDSKQVKFVKQYFGTATHSIYYEGDVQVIPPLISGHWGYQPGNKFDSFKITYQ